jgi:hypothetical protein
MRPTARDLVGIAVLTLVLVGLIVLLVGGNLPQ